MTDDIVDRIDALVDEQLVGGEPLIGYDYGDPTYPNCARCERKWHGLPFIDCLGSAVEGPMPPEAARGFATGGMIRTAPLGTPLPTDDAFDPSEWINTGIVEPQFPRVRFSPWQELLFRQVLEFTELREKIVALGGTWDDHWTIEEARAEHTRLALERVVIPSVREAIHTAITMFGDLTESIVASMESIRQGLSGMAAHLNVEPDTRTPQQRALPRPSTTPPMWAHDPTRSRRPKRKKNQPTRQGIA